MSERLSATLLVVEDDENLRLALADNLQEEGYLVRAARNAEEARLAFSSPAPPNLVVLDVMLPDGDGYRLCKEFRRQAPAVRLLMLTARTLEEDIVRGLDAGADDYLTKPYRLAELLARVRALLRRGTGPADDGEKPSVFAGFTMDRAARTLVNAAGQPVELTRTEFDLLRFLLDHPERALPRQEILDAVWGEDIVVDARTIDNFVSSLKKKMGWTPGSKFEFVSVRGVGYRLRLTE